MCINIYSYITCILSHNIACLLLQLTVKSTVSDFLLLFYEKVQSKILTWLMLSDYDRIIKNIERGEARISRKDEIMKAIGKKLDRYKNPWLELKILYGQNKGKLYNEECDRFMVQFENSFLASLFMHTEIHIVFQYL